MTISMVPDSTSILTVAVSLMHGLFTTKRYLLEDAPAAYIHHSRDFIMKELVDAQSSIVLCGHSHIPRCVKCNDRYLINPEVLDYR